MYEAVMGRASELVDGFVFHVGWLPCIQSSSGCGGLSSISSGCCSLSVAWCIVGGDQSPNEGGIVLPLT